MKPILYVALAALLVTATAIANEKNKSMHADVMIMGTFHFDNPQLDHIKTDIINVMDAENQRYLQTLSQNIATKYRPTHVLVECTPSYQATLDQKFADYLASTYTLELSENYQVGFRVAKQAGIDGVICFDNKSVTFSAGPLFEYMGRALPEKQKAFEAIMENISEEEGSNQRTKTLKQLLHLNNNTENDVLNKSLYIWLNDVTDGEKYLGADAAASWWHRNLKMYANIQQAATPNSRVFVIAGHGHAAILKDFVQIDSLRTVTDVNQYL